MDRFWRPYLAVVDAYVADSLGMAFSPAAEARLAPGRIDQAIEHVERVGERLYWTWVSEKVHPLASDDIDVYLRDGLADRMVVSVYRASDGMPWRAATAMGLGRHRLRYCTTLPPHVTPDDTVTVAQRAWYRIETLDEALAIVEAIICPDPLAFVDAA